MTLTLSDGPLSSSPPETNYSVEGPEHRLLFSDFPRRVRGRFEGATVVDTTRGRLLHETGILPVFYAPIEDLDRELLEDTDHSTHCPFKGDASYWSLKVGDRVAENAVWYYPEPTDEAPWLEGYAAFYWESMDAWLDEEQEIRGHLPDPYHRVDVRPSSRHVRVTAHGETIAESERPLALFETGLGVRFYLPPDHVRRDLLESSDTETVCPYKGTASWWTLNVNGARIEDAAWSYPDPLDESLEARDHITFSGEGIAVEVDGEQVG